MGSRKAMPLLSTLAALVIIVNSAEEEHDRTYRHEVLPRSFIVDTTNYDLPWRSLDTEPMMQKATTHDGWHDSAEEPSKRRRPVRKRRRRPATLRDSQETYTIHNDDDLDLQGKYHPTNEKKKNLEHIKDTEDYRLHETDQHTQQTTEMPKRRRKRPEKRRNRWTEDYVDAERPLRRRGVRRKRPSMDSWPRLSEFDFYTADREPNETAASTITERTEQKVKGKKVLEEFSTLHGEETDYFPETTKQILVTTEPIDTQEMHLKEDRSLSEFSLEDGPDQLKTTKDGEHAASFEHVEFGFGPTEYATPKEYDVVLKEYRVRPKEHDVRTKEYDVRPKEYDVKPKEYDVRPKEYNVRPKEYNVRPKEYDVRPKEYDVTPKEYDVRPKEYEVRPKEYDVTPKEYNVRPKDYDITPKEYNVRPKDYDITPKEYNVRPKEYDVTPKEYDVGPKEEAKMDMAYKEHVKAAEKLSATKPSGNLIDPVKLKEILSRSKGSSLSETLQKHNLSLADLLAGKQDALSLLKSQPMLPRTKENEFASQKAKVTLPEASKDTYQSQEQKEPVTQYVTENQETVTEVTTDKVNDLVSQDSGRDSNLRKDDIKTQTTAGLRRRIQGARRKLRMRPAMNGTYKSQLNRDLMAQNAKKYSNHRNIGKSKQWQYVIPLMNETETSEQIEERTTIDPTSTTAAPEDTTIVYSPESSNPSTVIINIQADNTDSDNEYKETTTQEPTTTQETTTDMTTTTTDKPNTSRLRPTTGRIGLRRQAFQNRLKRKRMKNKTSTTESPNEQEDLAIDLFGMPNMVSSSEFIARTQTPRPINTNSDEEDFTTLEDFITTERSKYTESGPRFTRNSTVLYIDNHNITSLPMVPSTTEETAKFEIEEILNDTRTSARLSRILMERNMTLNELVEHRERGSSHVHLADIFHNASKEPNPPEPFLSKSSIEPISKETYPLRALLEANLHDPKATTTDPQQIPQTQFVSIPVVMDFGNNVNENGENMGIITLFDKYANDDDIEKSTLGKDSEGTPYVTTVIALNNTDANDTSRDSRVLKNTDDHFKQDVVGWKKLIEVMRKNHQDEIDDLSSRNDTSINDKGYLPDADGDGVIVLEDLQGLKELQHKMRQGWDDTLNVNSYERTELPANDGIMTKSQAHTRSVTVATASIVGLAMILFLLTYAVFKWKQQRSILRKKQTFRDESIPSPVFENRKASKNNCSTRSVSPMLASNIYTMSTLDSNNGKESPDYMWDSLRKPFQ